MRFVIAVVLATLGLGLALPAEAQSRRGTEQVYYALTAADVQTLLDGQDYEQVKQTEPGVFTITVSDGFLMTVEQRVCETESMPDGCLGLAMTASWSYSPEQRPTLETLANTFNREYSIAKVVLYDNGIAIERYVITDGGVTRAHIERELSEFLAISDVLIDRMIEELGL
ncbi:YbjN domain-containing protein [Brevundimonas poindexterae]|mgnify:CR=1 FL=1|uniref:YbjN domain-containing protein n=1 Tax=Brevundimonas poindexterae TaxID=74325 RepID=UPI001CFF37DF|nr:YbjN domain-containing protein [Brevundimonas poindexterae]